MFSNQYKSKKYTTWILFKNPKSNRYLPLKQYIRTAQNDLNIPEEYKISKTEQWDMVDEILTAFKKDLTEQYFTDKLYLPKIKTFISVSYDEIENFIFMYLFAYYLENHICDDKFLEHDMHVETISHDRTDNGYFGKSYVSSHLLSDFAIIMCKLYYITKLYCEINNRVTNSSTSFNDKTDVEEIINSRQISVTKNTFDGKLKNLF